MSHDWMLNAGVLLLGLALVVGIVMEVFFPPQGINPEDWDTEEEL